MSATTCPHCDTREPVPIVYGLPDADLFADAEAGRVSLGGCVLGEDDPTNLCRQCGANLWGHGVFQAGENLRVRLGTPSHRVDASLDEEGTLWLSDADGMATLPGSDQDLVILLGVIEVFDDAAQMQRWCARRRIPAFGRAEGMVLNVRITGPDAVQVLGPAADLTVTTVGGRLLLHLLRDLTRVMRLRTVADIADYFEARGGNVTRSPVPFI